MTIIFVILSTLFVDVQHVIRVLGKFWVSLSLSAAVTAKSSSALIAQIKVAMPI